MFPVFILFFSFSLDFSFSFDFIFTVSLASLVAGGVTQNMALWQTRRHKYMTGSHTEVHGIFLVLVALHFKLSLPLMVSAIRS